MSRAKTQITNWGTVCFFYTFAEGAPAWGSSGADRHMLFHRSSFTGKYPMISPICHRENVQYSRFTFIVSRLLLMHCPPLFDFLVLSLFQMIHSCVFLSYPKYTSIASVQKHVFSVCFIIMQWENDPKLVLSITMFRNGPMILEKNPELWWEWALVNEVGATAGWGLSFEGRSTLKVLMVKLPSFVSLTVQLTYDISPCILFFGLSHGYL